MKHAILATLVLASVAVSIAGCGGAQQPTIVATPFLAEHEPMFENGLDMVRDPDALGGAWLGTWQEELDQRITNADVVALVTIRTLRTDVDLERAETYRLILSVDRKYLGEVADELTLVVHQDEHGNGTIENNERRHLDQQFIAFEKWQDTETGVRARWHLSPATDAVASETRRLLASRRQVEDETQGRRTVIVHRN
ncbi:MAG: hypothetical protein AB7P00_22055 [Sandaracinaceae bacterium]